jgi:hypothetical protein
VKVLDFGIAWQSGATSRLTQTGSILGTPGYMAPEQARAEREVGPPTDVFALGCVLFECLTGEPAFQGEHLVALLAKLLLEEPPRLLGAGGGVARRDARAPWARRAGADRRRDPGAAGRALPGRRGGGPLPAPRRSS